MKVRPCTNTDEMRAAMGAIWHYFWPELAHRGCDQALRARAAARARARGLRWQRDRRRYRGLSVRSLRAGRTSKGGGRHCYRGVADASSPRLSARTAALADRRRALAWRTRRGTLGDGRHDLWPVRLRHGVDVGRD